MKYYSLHTLAVLFTCLIYSTFVFSQGVTTATMLGQIIDQKGEGLPGANVVAVHTPSGSIYGTITRDDGKYTIPNMRVGGPYKIDVTFIGYKAESKADIYLTLGQTLLVNLTLNEETVNIEEVAILGTSSNILNSDRSGTQTSISEESINRLPTVNRDLNDFTRLTPQATITADGGFSIAGVNNRYNSIFIDGAVNNDVFGLASSGTNGGQTGISPISMDAIEQFQIVVSPFDVTLGGFAGGGINAITRSGSNKFQGSAYWLFRNENFVGKSHREAVDPEEMLEGDSLDALRSKVADFNSNVFGARLGGPIIKDKLFFFVSAEFQREEEPKPYEFSSYEGDAAGADLDNLISKLNELGYDPGSYLENTRTLDSDKLLFRLDWNISNKHKLTARHSYTNGESVDADRSTSREINFFNTGVSFPSKTNSTAIELTSLISNKFSNNLIVGFTAVSDNRDPIGAEFPFVNIEDGVGEINFGSEEFSTANDLKQNIFTLTDNFNIYKGNHTITVGTHNEFYNMRNVFIRQNFGSYQYSSLADFLNDSVADQYDRSYSLVDNTTGDETDAAADFKAAQLGFYVQDKYAFSSRFSLTGGIRFDIPFFLTQPVVDNYFNDSVIEQIESFGYDMMGARAGEVPDVQFLVSPRIGFNWAVTEDRKTQVRGGIGIFTSRVPFVWPGGVYNNNGLTVGGTRQFGVPFVADPFNQPTAVDFGGSDPIPSGQMDLYSEKFKYPQVFRTSLAVDRELPWGLVATLEGIFTKTINNVFYYNYNLKPSVESLTGTPDNRPIFDRRDEIDDTYTRIILGANTSEGYTYNITAQLQKDFDKGFTGSFAYTFGSAKAIFEGTSSQNSSQWRGVHSVDGRNVAPLGRSDFDPGSRVVAFLSYAKEYAKHLKTTISLFYEGRSGFPFSYIYNDGGNLTNEDSRERALIYIPASQNDIIFDEPDDYGNATYTQQEKDDMWAAFNAYIENDKYLSEHRGEYAEKNRSRTPFVHTLDLRLLQDFFVMAGENKHQLQISLDILNFANLLNKNWGERYLNPGFGNYELVDFEGFLADGTTPTFTFNDPGENIFDLNDFSSRWRMQLGIRYIF